MSRRKPSDLQISEEKTLLSTRVAEIVAAKVYNPRTGKEDEFYRLDFVDWVNVIALTYGGEIVLIRQFRFGTLDIELEIPGGAVEKGESPLQAGQRELLEETGYAGKNARIIGSVCPNPAIQNNRCYTILVEDAELVAPQRMDDMEDIEVVVLPHKKIDELIGSGQICHGLVLNALMFYMRSGHQTKI